MTTRTPRPTKNHQRGEWAVYVEKIGNRKFYNRDDYDYPYIIQFDPIDDKGNGALTLSHTHPPTMGDDIKSMGQDCHYYFLNRRSNSKSLSEPK